MATSSVGSALVILRRREVESRTGLATSTIYQRIKERTFPAPIQLGPKSVGWLESEINSWLTDRVAARDKDDAGKSGLAHGVK